VKISGELPMMVLPNHKYLKKLFLEVSKMNQVESLQEKKKRERKEKDYNDCAGCVPLWTVIL